MSTQTRPGRSHRFAIASVAAVLLLAGCSSSASSPSPVESSESAQPSESSTPVPTQATAIVQLFYSEYLQCMSEPPADAIGQVGRYCQGHSSYTSDSFLANLDAGGVAAAGADPITCSQNPPADFQASSYEAAAENTGMVTVDMNSSLPTKYQVLVAIRWLEDQPQVDNISCPKP